MIKLIITMKKKPGMSRSDFIEYYNTQHFANISKIVQLKAAGATCNFVVDDDPLLAFIGDERLAEGQRRDFDAATEIMFDSRADAEYSMHALYAEENKHILEQVRADEENFIDMSSIKYYMVDAGN